MMDTWLGDTKSNLITKWGVPSQVFENGNEGEILVYDKRVNYVMRSPVNFQAYGSSSYTKSYQFFVDQNGKIYRWLVNNK